MADLFELSGRASISEFQILKEKYEKENSQYTKKLIFHVGTGAGLFSELGAMLECMCYCKVNQISFSMYADDANFSNENGWTEFFEEFCEMNHNPDNKKYNYRYKKYYRVRGIAVPNLLFRRFIKPYLLKKKENVDYLTQDVFDNFVSSSFRFGKFEWPMFKISKSVADEYARLTPLALRYNDRTANDIKALISSLNLPDEYVSIQIRGGDKTQEFTEIIDAEYCIKFLESKIENVINLFVFTDDYKNVEYIRKVRPEWNVYTLTRPDECGYYNDVFNALPWTERRKDLIKVFAIIDICVKSKHHIGCKGACINNYIRSCRINKAYDEYSLGIARTKKGFDKIKRILGI